MTPDQFLVRGLDLGTRLLYSNCYSSTSHVHRLLNPAYFSLVTSWKNRVYQAGNETMLLLSVADYTWCHWLLLLLPATLPVTDYRYCSWLPLLSPTTLAVTDYPCRHQLLLLLLTTLAITNYRYWYHVGYSTPAPSRKGEGLQSHVPCPLKCDAPVMRKATPTHRQPVNTCWDGESVSWRVGIKAV